MLFACMFARNAIIDDCLKCKNYLKRLLFNAPLRRVMITRVAKHHNM